MKKLIAIMILVGVWSQTGMAQEQKLSEHDEAVLKELFNHAYPYMLGLQHHQFSGSSVMDYEDLSIEQKQALLDTLALSQLGYTLGLRHNFKGPSASVMDP